MPRFRRLTRADLDSLTRSELLGRLTAESEYWERKCAHILSEADVAALDEYGRILRAASGLPAVMVHAVRYAVAHTLHPALPFITQPPAQAPFSG